MMKHNNNKNTTRKTIKPVEARYNRALQLMRTLRVSSETKEIQEELSWLRKDIEDYNFTFFANHFVFDKVTEFERLVSKLQAHPSTK